MVWTSGNSDAADAYTQAGELIIVTVDPDSNKLMAKIAFMEYFSGPGEFMPGMPWRSKQLGRPSEDRTMWMIDGRPVKWQVVQRPAWVHISTIMAAVILTASNIYSHERVTVGAYQDLKDNTLELQRWTWCGA